MAAVSLAQIAISVTYVGRHVIHHSVPVAEFKKKFAAVAVLLLVFDVAIAVTLIASTPKDDKCTSLDRPWFLANMIVLFCLIPNIFYQYIQN
jgi:NADH:ubiquinone oxidoreductase subunit 3 (subunit A)